MVRLFESLKRAGRHLKAEWFAQAPLTAEDLARISAAIEKSEGEHSGQLVVVVDRALPLRKIARGKTVREFAIESFASEGVWDTAANNGVLLFFVLAERRFEIVADRGISDVLGNARWDQIAAEIEDAIRRENLVNGILTAVSRINEELIIHFPNKGGKNELENTPIVK